MEGGNNLEQATALVAAANRVIQDPNSVGSALRTISLRLRGTSVKILEEMGEETDNVVESTSKLQEKLKALTGVDILTDAGEYKDTYTILKEIGEVWQDLEELDKAAALELMAGKNRANTLSAILNNMKDLEGAYQDALNAEGSAMRENEAYLDSIQGRVDLFNNAVQTFWMNLINSDTVKGFVDIGTDLITFADTFIGKLTAIGVLLLGFARIKGKIKFVDMFGGLANMIQRALGVTEEMTVATISQTIATKIANKEVARAILMDSGLAAAEGALTKELIKKTTATLTAKFRLGELTVQEYIATMATMGLKTAFQALGNVLLKNPFVLIAALVAGVALAFDHFSDTAQEAADKAKEAFDEIQSVVDSTESTIRSLESEISNLQDKIDEFDGKKLSFADDEELKRLKKQKSELEHTLQIQQDLLDMQKVSRNKQAVASMEAYTKAASQGAEKTQKSWKTALTAVGVVLGSIIGAVATGGTSLGVQAAAVAAGAAGFGIAGNKAGESIGSKVSENDGTYDSWYNTYTKAIDTAREEEKKALEEYQKDSSNIKKLDAWREAQQKTIDIETEMYDHLSRMQEYYNGLSYGQDDVINKELDEWYNFLDKFAVEKEASGAKDNALDRIFGENASEEIQGIRDQILEAIENGEEFDFHAAINGCEELKNILDYIVISEEDVKNYFTQIGEAAQVVASKDIAPVKTYSALVEDLDGYNEVLKQTQEVITNNTEVSQEYKDSLEELGISSQDLAECFDENNELIVTNADLLNDLVKSAKNNITQNTKLAKTQARLKYYDLYKQMCSLTNGRKVESAATLAQVNSLYQEMSALEKVIAKYSMLEHQLLGTTNAYDKLADAQAADEAMDYGSKAEELVSVLANAFNTAELGTEAAQVAIAGLVPDSVIDKAKTLDEQMQQIYTYFTSGTVSKLFTIEFDDDGGITSVEMTKENIEAFTESLIGSAEESAVFQGTWDDFTLNPAIKTLQQFADAIGATKEVAFAYLASLEKYDISWMGGDFTTLLDQLMPNAEAIRNVEKQMQEEFNQTPINLTARVKVNSDVMQAAGWDVADGEYSTVHTVTYQASEFGLSDENGNDYAINVTPILPDGTPIEGGDAGLREYINKQIENGDPIEGLDIFLGSYQTIQEAETAAQRLHELQEQYYNMLENYSIDNDIYDTMQKIADLEMKIANGTISADEQSIYGSLLNEMETLEETALNNSVRWMEISQSLDLTKEKLRDLNEEFDNAEEGTAHYQQLEDEIRKTQEEANKLLQEMEELGEPTELTLEVGLDEAKEQIEDFKENLDELVKSGDIEAIEIQAVIEKIDETGFENLGLTKNPDGTWNGLATIEGYSTLDEASQAKVVEYINLINGEHVLDTAMGDGIPTIEQHLANIAEILQKTYELQVKPEVDKTPVISFIDWLKNTPISKTISLYAQKIGDWFGIGGSDSLNGTAHVNGTAYKSGSWGAAKTETALVGELGPELLVRGNQWTTIGDNGAEFTQVKKGDVIFNHKQTKELLSKGYVTGRGKLKGGSAFLSGTAYAGINTWDDAYGNVHNDYQNAAGDLSGAADDLSDAADEFNDVVDWVEIRLEEINEQLELLNAQMENAVGYIAKNQIIDKSMALNNTKLYTLKSGMAEYERYAAQLLDKVPAQYRDAVQNGMISIDEFTGEANEETVEAINNYREWAQKVADLRQQIEELEGEIVELAKTKFDNVADEYDNIVGLIENANEKLEAQVSLMEDRGYVASTQYYESMMVNTRKIQDELKKERDILQSVLDEQVRLGNIKVGSDAWYEMIDQLYEVDAAIVDCTSDLEDYQNSINDIYWDNFDELINRINYLKDETQSLIDLMDSNDLVITPESDDGWSADDVRWTDEGIASLGLYAQQMEIAEYQSKQYAQAINDLNRDYAAGKYSESEYLEKLNELTSAQYESIEAYYDAQDAIKDLNKARVDEIKNGIEKQIEAYEKLINKKKEALDAEKDAYDFQRSIEESNKEIMDIERKIAALASDNSASARAQRAKLQAELAKAQQDLQDKYYDHSVEDQKEALDKELENFKEEKDAEMTQWEEYLEDIERVLTDSLTIVKDNAINIYDTLNNKAEEYDLTLSDSIMSPWQNGSLAISDYQNVFDTAMSSTMDQLGELKAEWQNIIDLMARAADVEIASQNRENNNYTSATSTRRPSSTPTSSSTSAVAQPTIKIGGKINAGNAKIFSFAGSTTGYKQYYEDDPIYKVLAIDGDWVQVRHHRLSTGVTGWFKKGHVNAYAKGTKGVKNNQLALIDELGDELVMHADGNGKLAFLSKGSAVIPHDISENLMQLGQLNPQDALDRNRPVINAPHITNNNIELNVSFGEVVHIDHVDNNAVPNLAKTVEKQIDKYMKGLNAEIRKFTR